MIRFEVLKETSIIVLHSRNITIIDKWVKEEVEDGHRVEPLNISQLLEYRPFQMVFRLSYYCDINRYEIGIYAFLLSRSLWNLKKKVLFYQAKTTH